MGGGLINAVGGPWVGVSVFLGGRGAVGGGLRNGVCRCPRGVAGSGGLEHLAGGGLVWVVGGGLPNPVWAL